MFLKLYHAKRYCIMPREEPLGTTLTESVPEAFELPASDWPEKKFLANQRSEGAMWLWCFLTWCRFPHRSPLLHSAFNWESFLREVSEKNVNVIAKLFAFVCVLSLCVCVYPLNQDVSQAIIGALFSVPSSKDGRMGRFRGFSSLHVEV